MKNLLNQLWATSCFDIFRNRSVNPILFLLIAFCSTSFATYTVSNTSSSASVTGSFAYTIQEINNSGSSETIEFDIPGAGPHAVPMGGLTCYYGLAMSPFGIDIVNLSGDFYVYDPCDLSFLTISGNIIFRDGSDLDNVNVSGSVTLEDNGTSRTIQDCNFISCQLNLSTNYTVGNRCTFSNATVNLIFNCDVQATNWSGNNTLTLNSNNKITHIANGNLIVAGDYNNITRSTFKSVSLTGDNNIFKNNTISFSFLTANFTGDDNLISSNSFSSGFSRSPTITGTRNDFFQNHSFSNDTGVQVIGNFNKVQGNIIGLNKAGDRAMKNQNDGVEINGWNNTIGGGFLDEENYISGNGGHGIKITAGAWNKIYNNYIGIGINSTNNVGNNGDGININSSFNNIIDKENYISGNGGDGIEISGGGTNEIFFNYIGLPLNGANKTGNDDNGIFIFNSSSNIIGNSTFGGNYISDNEKNGIKIDDGFNNSVYNNFIGIDVSGTNKHGNSEAGVYINSGASNTIGDVTNGKNYICNNGKEGIYSQNSSVINIQNNFIGINISNNAAGNFAAGVRLQYCNPSTIINNSIADNKGNGISIKGGGETENSLIGANFIGVLGNGDVIGNTNAGIYLETARYVTIGTNNFRNVISGNDGPGIKIFGGRKNFIQNNIIGMNAAGNLRKSNSAGIIITNSFDNLIGGSSTNYRNYISGNNGNGIEFRAKCTNNFVQHNYIGIGFDGTNNMYNSGHGIFMLGHSAYDVEENNFSENIIGFNKKDGIHLGDDAEKNRVDNNFIGIFPGALADIGNEGNGIFINGLWNEIGLKNGNFIGGNYSNGILISDCKFNEIRGNCIGVYVTGLVSKAFPNLGNGIAIVEEADFNDIGETNAGQNLNYNIITANKKNGIFVGELCSGNEIRNNYIGMTPNKDLSIPINGDAGIYVHKSSAWIGGLDAGKENYIVGKTCIMFDESIGSLYRNFIGFCSGDTNVAIGIHVKNSENFSFGQTSGGHENYIGLANDAAILIENSTNINVRAEIIGIDNFDNSVPNNGDGFRITNSFNCFVQENYIAGSKNGINIVDSDLITVRNNYIGYKNPAQIEKGNREFGIKISRGKDIKIDTENYISGNQGHAVEFADSLDSIIQYYYIGLATNGTDRCENKGDGIRLINSENIVAGNLGFNIIAACDGNAVFISGGKSNEVSSNKIGVDKNGNSAVNNGGTGVKIVNSSDNYIYVNTIGANDGDGICITGGLASANNIVANSIGIGSDGTTLIPNGKCGVNIVNAPGNFIGGVAGYNFICGNGEDGVRIEGSAASNNLVSPNAIGLNQMFGGAGNTDNGVNIIDASDCTVSNNNIAFNGYNGVNIKSGFHNCISENSIFNNGKMGINLGPQGRTSGYSPIGANNFQPYPVLKGAYLEGLITRVVGNISAQPNSSYLLEFFADQVPNSSGYGEGQVYLGSKNVETAPDGLADFSFNFDSVFGVDSIITATATAENRNSSEFSVQVKIETVSLSADFAVDKTLVLTGAVLNFTDTSVGIPTVWAWDFDNNGSTDSTLENPQYSYSSVGDKSVKLTVTDSANSTIVKTNIIRVAGAKSVVTNETDNLQNLIDSLNPFDIIELAEGTYSQPGRNFNGQNILVLDNNVTITGDDAILDGLGTMRCAYVISGRIVGVTFQNGNANGADANGQGGAAACGEAGEINRCKAMNSSAIEGGGFFVENGGIIKSCLIISNNATSGGGTVVATGGAAFNSTIADNTATTSAGGAICSGEMVNNIIYYNTAPTDQNITISGGTFIYGCTTPAKSGTGNISNDPEFLQDYGIDLSSPCAEAALELDWMSWSKDITGEPRLRGNEIDMGAYSAVIPEPSLFLILLLIPPFLKGVRGI